MATISGCTLSGNSAAVGGGGIYVYHGTATISGCTLSGNSANYGGGIYISPSGTVTVENSSSIVNNLAPAGYSADDVDNLGLLYWDLGSIIGALDNTGTVVRI